MTICKKPVTREFDNVMVYASGKDRPLVLTLHPNGLVEVRIKGTRTKYHTSVKRIYDGAVGLLVPQSRFKRRI